MNVVNEFMIKSYSVHKPINLVQDLSCKPQLKTFNTVIYILIIKNNEHF